MKKALKVLSTVMAAGMLAACGSTAASSAARKPGRCCC